MIKVLVIAAMYEELHPFLNIFDGFALKKLLNREEYHYKRTSKFGKDVELFCAVHPDYSKVSSACHTSRMMSNFNADIAIMIGICAGDETKVKLGDTIVSKKIIDYETGKVKEKDFYPEMKSYEVKDELKQFIDRFILSDKSKMITNNVKYDSYFETIATGTSVVEKDTIFKELQQRNDRKVLGLDMEAYAFAEAIKGINSKSYILAIKSVCDFANSNKNDNYHEIAAENSSKWAFSFLSSFIEENDFEYLQESYVNYQQQLQLPALSIEDRDQWYNILHWNSESEKFLKTQLNNTSGINFYPIDNGKYLIEILLSIHAYQETYCYYLMDLLPSTFTWKALSFVSPIFPYDTPDYRVDVDEIVCGLADFDSNTMELSVYTKFRGLGDGKVCTYKIYDNGSTELIEATLLTLNEEAFHNEDADIFNEPTTLDITSIEKKVLPLRIG